MTAERAIFQGSFADLKIIKGRKVGQFIIEVPIEGVDTALKALGGVPRPDAEVWVVVARLDPKAVERPPAAPEKAKKGSLTRQSAIACADPRFWGFLTDRGHPEADPIVSAEEAALMVHDICEVRSRAEFDSDPEAGARWQTLYTEFQAEGRI